MTDALARLSVDPPHTAVFCDFDGSLAEIVDHPDDAVPRPEVVPLLDALVARFGLVAVVSGRPVDFLRARLPVPGLVLVGQYGLERLDGDRIVEHPDVDAYAERIRAVADRAEVELPEVYVERKGRAAVTLHWRTGAAPGAEVERWAAAVATATGLVAHGGRMSVELRPPIAVDKGSVVDELAAGWRIGAFAGDDRGDLAAFSALSELVTRGVLVDAVRIAVRSTEAPPELEAVADVTVDGPAGLVALLSGLTAPA
jgi:trehalose 6-phosphate phosphatase